MERSIIIGKIIDTFDACASEFREKSAANFMSTSSEYKGRERLENIKYHYAKIYYERHIVVIKYTAHSMFSLTNSIIECLICFNKSDDTKLYPLSFLLKHMNAGAPEKLTFENISNEIGMREAMNILCDIISKYQNEIYEVATNDENKQQLEQKFYQEILKTYKEKELTEEDYADYREAYYAWFTNSNVSDTYKNDWREMVAFFAAAFTLTIPWTAFFLIIYFSLYALEKSNAIYLMGPIYMAPVAGFTGFLMGICTSYFVRLKAYKVLFRKSYQKYAELDTIANGTGSHRFIKVFTMIVFAGSNIFLALNVRCNLKFTDDGFYDNRKFFALSGEYCDYSEIEEIYYLPSRKNGFGATLESPSYVMKLKNGEEIDFYDYDETTSTEEKLIPVLKEKGIIIREK